MVIGKTFFVVGLITTFVTQILLIYLSFKVRAIHGLFCLIGTPIIVFISKELRNNSRIRAVSIIWVMSLNVWLSGLFLISVG